MQEATDLGIVLRELMVRHNLSQGKIAKKIGVQESTLSNYITGKFIPEMDFLAKCVQQFGLKQKGVEKGIDIVDFFHKAFLSTATNNHKVIFDTRFLDSQRIEILAKVLTVLVLYPKSPSSLDSKDLKTIEMLGDDVNWYFKMLGKEVEFHPSAD